MNAAAPSPIQQLLFGLKHGAGVVVLAHSMASQDEALWWQSKLEKHVRLQPWETQTVLPDEALSYYQFSDGAAVLRRWAAGGSLGRNNAHALIGPADVLTVQMALCLDRGLDWKLAAYKAQNSLPSAELTSLTENADADLRRRALDEPVLLRRALGRLIDAQKKPLTIIGCPDEHRVALMWALMHIGEPYLTRTCHIYRSWTFSTYEVEDADSIPDLPEILFMSGIPTGGRVARREVVDVSRDEPLSKLAQHWSATLIQRFNSDDPLLNESEVVPSFTKQSERQEQEPPREQPARDRRQDQATTGPYLKDWQEEAGGSPVPPAPAARGTSSQRLEKDIHDLLHAESADLLSVRLGVLGQTAAQRAELRQRLKAAGYLNILLVIKRLNPPFGEMLALSQRLRHATFGRRGEDLSDSDAAAFAVELVKHADTPIVFIVDLVQAIDNNNSSTLVDPALAVRWRAEHENLNRQLPAAGTRLLGAVASALATSGKLVAAAVIALLAILTFAGGYVIGTRGSSAAPPGPGSQTAQTTAPSTSGAQQGNGAGQPAGGSSATLRDLMITRTGPITDENIAVFLLLRTVDVDNVLHPQVECNVDRGARTWVCPKLTSVVSAKVPSPVEILVVKIDLKEKQRYQQAINMQQSLDGIALDPRDMLLREYEVP